MMRLNQNPCQEEIHRKRYLSLLEFGEAKKEYILIRIMEQDLKRASKS